MTAGGTGPALVEEASRKAALVWLSYASAGETAAPRPARHVWHEGAVVVVVGGGEQHLPGLELADRVEVVVPSKDTKAGVVTWVGTVEVLDPATDAWTAAARALAPGRLNAEGGEAMLQRWAQTSSIVRIAPSGIVVETADDPSPTSRAAVPRTTPATTLGRQPKMLGGTRRR